jgi:dihydrofolate reductase
MRKGTISEILEKIYEKNFYRLYIDGGTTIQGFLKEDLIDEMTITVIPILLGGGSPLFSELPKQLEFECTGSQIFLNKIVQNHFRRLKK